jgi:hypothetical protein
MKKIILVILLVLLGLCFLYVVFNRFDARPVPGMFSSKDLPAANFDYENGYYRLWTLGLDDKVDVESAAVKERYRRLFDPQFDNVKEIREFDVDQYKKETSLDRRMGKTLLPGMRMVDRIGDAPPVSFSEIIARREEFERFRQEQALIRQRYLALLGSDCFQDFTAPRALSPVPNLLLWLRLAKVHVGLSLVDAADGKWAEAADALLKQMDFGKKAVAGSGTLITNLVAKAVLNLSTQGLAFLMNQKDCPAEVFSRILEGMPPLRYEEYGSRNSFIGEFLFTRSSLGHFDAATRKAFGLDWMAGLLAPLGLQKNRTLNAYYDYIRAILEVESAPLQGKPLRILEPRKYRQGAFWWLRNPTGKSWMDHVTPNLGVVVFKALRARSLYDLTRISAELHLRYDPVKTVQENLNRLATYQVMDPCSGKPYIWNEEKQVLYSVGLDRVDGGGAYDRTTVRTDVVLPCILYVQAEVK